MITRQTELKISKYMELYDILVPKDNKLRQIKEMIDFEFIYEEVKNNACNTQYQIIMQDNFEHRYVMIAFAWFERAANFDPVTRTQSIFNACRTFFYPQEHQELWNRLNYESNS